MQNSDVVANGQSSPVPLPRPEGAEPSHSVPPLGTNIASADRSAQGGMEFLRPGITYNELLDWLDAHIGDLEAQKHRHAGASLRWRTLAGPLAWLAAVLAALSGLSIISDNQQYAQVLTIATAVIAATNAAVNPSDVARRHRAASLAYQHLANKVTDMQFFEVGEGGGLEDNEMAVPADQVRSIRERVNKFDEEKQALDEGAPPLGPTYRLLWRRNPRRPPTGGR